MDDLRWILAAIGAVIVMATYLSSRVEKEEWRRDRAAGLEPSQPVMSERVEPQIDTQIEIPDETSVEIQIEAQSKNQKDDNADQYPKQKKPAARQNSSGLNSEADVKKALAADESEPELESESSSGGDEKVKDKVDDKEEDSSDDQEDAADFTQEPLIEDEIVSVEIPAELAEFGEERRSESRPQSKPEAEKPFQQDLALDIEPLVLVLSVIAKDKNKFNGGDIKNAVEAERLKHGDMDIFHFLMTGKKDPVFSVASVVEPGTFNLKTIDEYKTPGLSLFCQFPNSMAGSGAFSVMLKKAQTIAEKLGGQLCDDKRNLLTEQATAHYRDQIVAFEHEMVIARKRQE